MEKATVAGTSPKMAELVPGKHMHGVRVVSQKIKSGVTVHIRAVILVQN
jgi:hypothetical protein